MFEIFVPNKIRIISKCCYIGHQKQYQHKGLNFFATEQLWLHLSLVIHACWLDSKNRYLIDKIYLFLYSIYLGVGEGFYDWTENLNLLRDPDLVCLRRNLWQKTNKQNKNICSLIQPGSLKEDIDCALSDSSFSRTILTSSYIFAFKSSCILILFSI